MRRMLSDKQVQEFKNKQDKLTAGTNITINEDNVISATGEISGTVEWDDIEDKPTFATVATSGSYNDLSNKPTIDNNNQTVKVGSTTFGDDVAVQFVAGSNVTITPNTEANTITIATSGGGGGGGGVETFTAVQGTTTFAEVEAAYNAGKLMFAQDTGGNRYQFLGVKSLVNDMYYFTTNGPIGNVTEAPVNRQLIWAETTGYNTGRLDSATAASSASVMKILCISAVNTPQGVTWVKAGVEPETITGTLSAQNAGSMMYIVKESNRERVYTAYSFWSEGQGEYNYAWQLIEDRGETELVDDSTPIADGSSETYTELDRITVRGYKFIYFEFNVNTLGARYDNFTLMLPASIPSGLYTVTTFDGTDPGTIYIEADTDYIIVNNESGHDITVRVVGIN